MMLRIVRQRLGLSLEGQSAYEFQKQVASTLSPLINGVRREYFRRVGLGNDEVEKWMQREQQTLPASPLLVGDLFIRDQDTVTYYRLPREENFLEAGVITRSEPSDYKDFFDGLLQIARSVTGDRKLEWSPAEVDGDVAAVLSGESRIVVPTPAEIEASRELENTAAQALIRQIIASNSIFFNKLSQALQQDRIQMERQIARFEELSVVSKDFAVLCRKTGQQILRVSSRAAIEDPSQKGFKCFICGNSVSEESIDEIITVTDFGRKLMDQDYWLVVRVLDALERAGINNREVHIQSAEGRLTNFFLTVNDQLFLLVVANNKITLEESYLINANLAAYGVKNAAIISTQRVSRLMRHHLEKSNPGSEFDFLDSLQGLEDRFSTLLRKKEKSVLRKVLENFSALTPVSVQDVVMQRISPDPDFFEKVTPPTRPKTRSAATKKSEAAAAARPSQPPVPVVEEAEQALPAPVETEVPSEFLMGEVFEEMPIADA